MAGITTIEPLRNCLSASMWEENGIQYRSNILHRVGAKIDLHAHNFDHTARIKGRMMMQVNQSHREVMSGEEVFIPAWAEHSFELIEPEDGIGEVLCYWRSE